MKKDPKNRPNYLETLIKQKNRKIEKPDKRNLHLSSIVNAQTDKNKIKFVSIVKRVG